MRLLFAALLALFVARTSIAESARSAVAAMEVLADKKLTATRHDPFEILGNTRGAYLPGYGAVFSTEVSLAFIPTPNPFRPPMTAAEIAAAHQLKKNRVPVLKAEMEDFLLSASASLDYVATNEQIVYYVNLFYFNWEDASGLPKQIIMQAEKGQLLNVQTGRVARETLASVVKVREL